MKELIKQIIIFLTVFAILCFGVNYIGQKPTEENLGIALPQAVAVFETSLQTGISSSATSMTLTANSIRGGSSLSGFNCFTVDEGSSNAEVICGTVTATAVASLTRGISYEDGETEVSGNKYSHRRGANVKITDFPIIQRLKAQNNGEATFVNQLSYEAALTPTADAHIITKKYADDLAIAGAPDASLTVKGILEVGTQIEIASTTAIGGGGTTAPLALTTAYSTSTPSGDSFSALYSVISENDGKLNQLWLDLTEAFTFSGTNIFSGLNTFSATTTMATTTVNELRFSDDTTLTTSTAINVQEFLTDDTWTKPTGAERVCVQAWGGGGGGGDATDAGTASASGGGGGGAYKEYCFDADDLGATEAVVAGTGGVAGAVGESSSFDILIAYGGGAGIDAGEAEETGGGGGGGSIAVGANSTTAVGGAGGGTAGSAEGVDNGGFGGAGGGTVNQGAGGNATYGGAGGSGGNKEGGSANDGGDAVYGGAGGGGNTANGGTSLFGGNGGAGGDNATGTAGTAPGGGGGGVYRTNPGTSVGGAGGDGQVIVTTHF